MKLYRTYGAIGYIGLMLRGMHPRLYYFAFTRLFRKFVPPLPILNNSYMLCSRSNEQKKRRCGLKPQRRKDRKILHEMLVKMGNFVPFARFVFEKTSKNACLRSIMKITYFKICYSHPSTEGSEWHMRIQVTYISYRKGTPYHSF